MLGTDLEIAVHYCWAQPESFPRDGTVDGPHHNTVRSNDSSYRISEIYLSPAVHRCGPFKPCRRPQTTRRVHLGTCACVVTTKMAVGVLFATFVCIHRATLAPPPCFPIELYISKTRWGTKLADRMMADVLSRGAPLCEPPPQGRDFCEPGKRELLDMEFAWNERSRGQQRATSGI